MGLVSSISSVLGIGDSVVPVTAAIGELDPNTGMEKTSKKVTGALGKVAGNLANAAGVNLPGSGGGNSGGQQAFQYFPETISDTKAPEWIRKNVPGGSHPILTFISGGERVLSFAAVFTNTTNPEPLGAVQAALTGNFEFGLDDIFGGAPKKHDSSIPSAIVYLRKFTYPDYANFVSQPPPFAVVYLPNSGITSREGYPDSIVGAMVQCDIIYEKFYRNGEPRITVIQLSFVETCQVGENWQFIGASQLDGILKSSKGVADLRGQYQREIIDTAPSSGGLLDGLF